MTHDVQAIRDDLAFMRALAQEGRRAPLLIGHNLLAAGLVYGTAGLFAWAVATRMLALPQAWAGAIWPVVTLLYVPYARYRRLQCRTERPGATALTNRAVGAAWRGVGFTLLSLMVASLIAAFQLKSYIVFALFPSVVLALYGGGWLVAAAMSETKWLRWVALCCFVASMLIAFTANDSAIYALTALALYLLMALPGWLLIRAEPSDVV